MSETANRSTSISTTCSSSSHNNHLLVTAVVPLYIGWRMYWANRMPIMDCDEVYNYWEPLHFWLFGSGFQTWEYANQFALRTYAYILPLWVYSKLVLSLLSFLPRASLSLIFSLLADHPVLLPQNTAISQPNEHAKLALFLILRTTLAACMAISELYFCSSLQVVVGPGETTGTTTQGQPTIRYPPFSHLSTITGILLLTSAGMSHSSGALLPSSTAMMLWLVGAGAFLREHHVLFCLVATSATLVIGWPFCVLLFIPMGLAVLQREFGRGTLWNSLLPRIIGIAVAIQTLVLTIDYYAYARLVSPIWNILQYNTSGGGDELYGTEPLNYYIRNILLNFNLVGPLGICVAGPLVVCLQIVWLWKHSHSRNVDEGTNDIVSHEIMQQQQQLLWVLLSLFLWLAVVFPRPHKEERFLFPVYPAMCLGAAIASGYVVHFLFKIFDHFKGRSSSSSSSSSSIAYLSHRLSWMLWIQLLLWIPTMLISFSRTMALSKYYTAPLRIYSYLQQEQLLLQVQSTNQEQMSTFSSKLVCTCGEWYRFPSSFYLPENFSFGFLPSSFEGQLPHPFGPQGSRRLKPDEEDAHPPPVFNDKNQHEPDRYVSIEDCDYLVDLWNSNDCRDSYSVWEPVDVMVGTMGGTNQETNGEEIIDDPPKQKYHPATASFLNADDTTVLHRTLYLPYLHEAALEHGGVEYLDYVLFRHVSRKDGLPNPAPRSDL